MHIENKVVLITGASDGIGAECARVFADRGARLSLTARSGERLRVVDATLERFGRIDILIAGAGAVGGAAHAPQGSGTIVNVGSVAGRFTLPWFTLYSVSKYTIGSLTEGLRMELKRDGIHAMAVCPGYVDTGFQSHILGGRLPAEIAKARRFAITARECAEPTAAARLLPCLEEAQLAKIRARQHAAGAEAQ